MVPLATANRYAPSIRCEAVIQWSRSSRRASSILTESAFVGETAVQAIALPDLAVFSLAARRGHDLRARAELALGLDLPVPGKTTIAGDLRAISVRPGQWLVVREGPAEELGALLADALGEAAMLIDLSGGHVGVRVRGKGARGVLAKFLPLDLHPRTMQAGQASATLAAHLPVLFWQADDTPTYELLCTRSLAGSFHHALEKIGVDRKRNSL
jgi:heterotetrameric sarcosine oxidase gamma subunit